MNAASHNDQTNITDLSYLGAENIKFRNTKFLNSDKHYYGIHDHETWIETRARIWRIRNGDIRKMMRRFPCNEPVHDQCALWVRGVAGRQFFPDANHRTAISLLRDILLENGFPQQQWNPQHSRAARAESKRFINRFSNENRAIRLDTLYEHDELFDLWLQFFNRELLIQ